MTDYSLKDSAQNDSPGTSPDPTTPSNPSGPMDPVKPEEHHQPAKPAIPPAKQPTY